VLSLQIDVELLAEGHKQANAQHNATDKRKWTTTC